jgi:hypothetical protein
MKARLLLLALFALPLSAAPRIDLSEVVTISGITPGGKVALLGVAREPGPYMSRLVTYRELLTDADADGMIVFTPRAKVAHSSIWIAVDVETGSATTVTPSGALRPFAQKSQGRGPAIGRGNGTLDFGRGRIVMLVVRPEENAWFLALREGGSADLSKNDRGRVRADLARMRPINDPDGPALHTVKEGDVVAVIDPEAMEHAIVIIERGN